MKKKHNLQILITITALILSFFLVGCRRLGTVVGIKMASDEVVEVKAGEFSYDGIKVILIYEKGDTREVNLVESMISEADKLNFYKMGEHEITVSYTSKITTTMKINVVRHEFDDIYRLDSYTCVYDGMPHKIEINYELPEGTTVEYPYGNTFINAGEYNVEAIISKAGYVTKKLNATLIIEKASLDLSNVKFTDNTVEYDGTAKTLEVENLPEGVKVEYEIWNQDKTVRLNNAINVGSYVFVAKFGTSDENFDQTQTMDANLTITKASYDMSGVKLADAVKEYDGNDYKAKLVDSTALPEDITVSFKYFNMEGKEVESTKDAGEYKIVASFEGKNANYEEIPSMEAKLTVTKKPVMIDGKVIFNSKTINFDRQPHSLEINGNLPDGVTVSYENNNQIIAGEYKVIARFENSNKNQELDITELEAYLIINKTIEAPQVVDPDTGLERDLEDKDLKLVIDQSTGNKKIEIPDLVQDKYEISSIEYTNQVGEFVDVNDFTNNVKYNYEIVFKFIDEIENASVTLSPVSGTLQYSITFDRELRLDDLTFVYDGRPHGLVVNKELPVGTKVEYPSGEEFVDVGIYPIKWVLTKETYASMELDGNLKIVQAKYDMSGVVLENVERVFDGNDYTPTDKSSPTYNPVFDNLPKGVTVKEVKTYTKVGEEWQESAFTSNVGEYKYEISFSYDELNYEAVQGMTFILTVTQQVIDLSAYKFENATVEKTQAEIQALKDANQKLTTSIQPQDLPANVAVSYDYKLNDTSVGADGVNDFGVYQVIATFSVTDTNYKLEITSLTSTFEIKEIGG